MTSATEPPPKRPLSVSLIAWFLIAAGILLGAVLALLWLRQEIQVTFEDGAMPWQANLAVYLFSAATGLVSGLGLLRGLGWTRWLLVGSTLALIFFGLFAYPLEWDAMLDPLLLGLVCYFLFGEKANAWFGKP